MRNITLLTGTMLFLPVTTMAQSINCTPSPDCASLGYTESSCPDGAGVKCPWGNTWFCTKTCDELGFSYTCSGTGYAGGSGEVCKGKYKSCTCASGYKWNQENGTCEKPKVEWGKCNGLAKNCKIGDILYSDGTCSPKKVSGKTPIAVVVYKSADGNCAQAMALKSIGNYMWGGYNKYISGLPELGDPDNDSLEATYDLNSCTNTQKIMAAGDKNTYPAAWAAHEYKTEGTEAGDWYLPAAGIFTSYYNNQQLINTGMTNAGGTQIGDMEQNLSSSQSCSHNVWCSSFAGYPYGLDESNLYNPATYHYCYSCSKRNTYEVRPVLEF